MLTHWLCTLPLLWGGNDPTTVPPGILHAQDAVGDLIEAYDEAVEDWLALIRSSDFEERKVLRKAPPALEFKPRFDALAEKGEGRALLWLASEARAYSDGAKAARVEQRRYLDQLVEEHVSAEWFEDVVASIASTRRVYEEEQIIEIYGKVAANAASLDARARALYEHAVVLARRGDKENIEAGKVLLRQVVDEYPGTNIWDKAKATLTKPEPLKAGMQAPNFTGRTVAGHEFQLSDYRGKVVLLDFYGFW